MAAAEAAAAAGAAASQAAAGNEELVHDTDDEAGVEWGSGNRGPVVAD